MLIDRASFGSVKQWVTDARQYKGESLKLMLVGNKMDVADKRYASIAR